MTPDELRCVISALGMTQVAFARRIGVAPQTVRRWLAGRRRISRSVTELVRLLQREKKEENHND